MEWVIRVGLIIIGVILILKGIFTKAKNTADLEKVTKGAYLSDSPLGCLADIITIGFGGLSSKPVWLVKTLWILFGIGLILLGLLSNLKFGY